MKFDINLNAILSSFLPQCFFEENFSSFENKPEPLFSSNILCEKVDNEYFYEKTGVSCYFLNIFNILKDRKHAGLKDIKITRPADGIKVLDAALEDARAAFKPNQYPLILDFAIFNDKQLRSMANIPGPYLWCLMIDYLEQHYGNHPLLPNERIAEMAARYHKSKHNTFLVL